MVVTGFFAQCKDERARAHFVFIDVLFSVIASNVLTSPLPLDLVITQNLITAMLKDGDESHEWQAKEVIVLWGDMVSDVFAYPGRSVCRWKKCSTTFLDY